MIHKEEQKPDWMTGRQSLVDLVSEHFNGGSGNMVSLYDVEKFLRAYFHPMQSRIASLEKEVHENDKREAEWFLRCSELEIKLEKYKSYCERNGLTGL
jgi:hypothetical protein